MVVWRKNTLAGRLDISQDVIAFNASKTIDSPTGTWSLTLYPRQLEKHREVADIRRLAELYQALEVNGLASTLLVRGNHVLAGAPGYEGTGAMIAFEFDPETGTWGDGQVAILPFDAARRSGFGSAVAGVGNEILIGAPTAERRTGQIYATRWASETWYSVTKVLGTDVAGSLGATTVDVSGALTGGLDRRRCRSVLRERNG